MGVWVGVGEGTAGFGAEERFFCLVGQDLRAGEVEGRDLRAGEVEGLLYGVEVAPQGISGRGLSGSHVIPPQI